MILEAWKEEALGENAVEQLLINIGVDTDSELNEDEVFFGREFGRTNRI